MNNKIFDTHPEEREFKLREKYLRRLHEIREQPGTKRRALMSAIDERYTIFKIHKVDDLQPFEEVKTGRRFSYKEFEEYKKRNGLSVWFKDGDEGALRFYDILDNSL